MNLDKEIEYLKIILLERNKGERPITAFFSGVNILDEYLNLNYESIMKVGVPDTCAVQIYRGLGKSPEKAFNDMAENIKNDLPLVQDNV